MHATVVLSDPREIVIHVRLFADLRRFLPDGSDEPVPYQLPADSTGADLLAAIGIPEAGEVTIGRNGEIAAHEDALRDGDEVLLFSPMEGG
jgi:sulfur carrier protein ThiS